MAKSRSERSDLEVEGDGKVLMGLRAEAIQLTENSVEASID
jgi:hypothetical protein